MWKKLPSSIPFFLSYTQNNGYCIYVTDFIKIWWAHFKENDFMGILKKSNDDLEMENDDQLLQMGLKMLHQPEELRKLNINFEEKFLSISMSMSCGFPLYLDIKLAEGTREMFFTKITQQLLKTVVDLKASENELRNSLIKKDKEIEEYKTETDVRLAMYLKTGIFRDEEHMNKHPVYKENFGAAELPSCLLEKATDAVEDQVIVKQEIQTPVFKVKEEPQSQEHVKTESQSFLETEASSTTTTVKCEIKSESTLMGPKKKMRKLLKI